MTTEQRNFIGRVGILARAEMEKCGVLASVTVAQAILESNWGNSGLTKKGNALFGIKAGKSWYGPRVSCNTFEFYEGKRTGIVDAFRAYGSWEESVADHSRFLCGLSRYRAVVGERDYVKACNALQAAGYATAPNYAQSLIGVIKSFSLTDWDSGKYRNAPAPAKPQGDYREHVIQGSSDTLWALASRYLGSGSRWPEIAKASGGIDPRKIKVGDVVKIPRK